MARAAKANKATLVTTQNLALHSEDFSDAYWTKSTALVSANAGVAPDGTTTADLLYNTADQGQVAAYRNAFTVVSGLVTSSIFAKPSGKSWIGLLKTDGTGIAAYFNVSTGATGTVAAGYTANIVADRNGYYRCSVTSTISATASMYFGYYVMNADGATTFTANGTDGVLFWGAQVVQANWAGPYVQTVAAAVNTGPIRNKAASRATLVATQNLLKYSEQFNQASGWTPSGGLTVTPNATTAPDGTATADELVCPLADGYIPSAAATMPNKRIGTQYVLSVWLWSAAKAAIGLRAYTLPSVLSGAYMACNLTATPTRFELPLTLTSSLDSQIVLDIENRAIYGSDGLAGNVYAWGAQIVNANRAGVYVKTEAAAVNTGNIRNTP